MQVLQADFLRTWSQVRGDLPAKTPHDCLTVHCLSRLLLLELHPDVQECPLSVLKPLLLRGVCSDPGTPLYLALRPVFHHLCEILTLFCYLYQRGYQRGTLPQSLQLIPMQVVERRGLQLIPMQVGERRGLQLIPMQVVEKRIFPSIRVQGVPSSLPVADPLRSCRGCRSCRRCHSPPHHHPAAGAVGSPVQPVRDKLSAEVCRRFPPPAGRVLSEPVHRQFSTPWHRSGQSS